MLRDRRGAPSGQGAGAPKSAPRGPENAAKYVIALITAIYAGRVDALGIQNGALVARQQNQARPNRSAYRREQVYWW